MSAKNNYLFCMDLRIYNQTIKLKVYEQDSLSDLINRLAASIKDKQISKEKLTSKLEDQFKNYILRTGLSQVVTSKLSSLVDESKIIIMGIDTDKNQKFLSQTPPRILQESTIQSKKFTTQKLHKDHNYLNTDNPTLHFKYDSPQLGTPKVQKFQHQGKNYGNLISFSKNTSPIKLDYQLTRLKDQSEIFQKKYEALDRKCQNFISKNIPNAQLLDFKRYYYPYQHKNRGQQPYHRRGGYQDLIRQNDLKLKQLGHQTQYLRVLNENDLNKYRQGGKSDQTFQQYKVNRYKNTCTSALNLPKYQQNYREHRYQLRENRDDILPSKSYDRVKYSTQKGRYARLYQETNQLPIRFYVNLKNNRLVAGNSISCKRLKGKFNYLGE